MLPTPAPPDRLRRGYAAVIWQKKWFAAISSRPLRPPLSHTVGQLSATKNMIVHSKENQASNLESSPWPFFALALGWSWLFWIPIVLFGINITLSPGGLIFAIGGLGPVLSAIILTLATRSREKWQDYWRRVIDFKRISLKWYAVIFLLAPLYSVLALLTGYLIRGRIPPLETAVSYLNSPLTILPFVLFTLFYGPLPEELGWRGYVLDRLQGKWNALVSSLILGVIWSLWHAPMFFMRGSLQSEVFPLNSVSFWLAMGPGILAEAVIMTWIYNNTQRSTLSAILFHFMMNFTGEFLRLPSDFKNYQFLWLSVIAILVVLVWKPATFTLQNQNWSKPNNKVKNSSP
jgi:membrane protease YdiL (CAAX protease family)